MSLSWQESIQRQRESLGRQLAEPLEDLAHRCARAWGDRGRIDDLLIAGLQSIPNCTFLYALNPQGVQICDNVSHGGLLPEHFGRDRSERPYMREMTPADEFLLSDAYISLRARRPSLTALQRITGDDGGHLGYLGADFDLRDLPVTAELYDEPGEWRQIKGDPAIRGTVFQQCRTESLLDCAMEQGMSILEELFTQHGVFQTVIHFSSSRATIWLMNDPYRYRILDHEALADPDICLAYPKHVYADNALIPAADLGRILSAMADLRRADENIYLRSASINIFNGMISLTFSCDGTHYMSHREFLAKDMNFWVGSAA